MRGRPKPCQCEEEQRQRHQLAHESEGVGAECAASRMPESLAYARLPACDCSESISGRQLPPRVAMPAPWRTQPATRNAVRSREACKLTVLAQGRHPRKAVQPAQPTPPGSARTRGTAPTHEQSLVEVRGSALRCGAPGAAKAVTVAPWSYAGAGAGAAQAPSASRHARAKERTKKLARAIAAL